MPAPRWYLNAIIYGLMPTTFRDSDGDGVGDLRGIVERMDYLRELGVTCLWLLPLFASPHRDNGYDVEDYLRVDPRLGTMDDFLAMVHSAKEHGIRVILDLVVNHTSDTHAWFLAASHDPESRYHEYYVWSDAPPPVPASQGTIFPGESDTVWTFAPDANAYYHHRFYPHEPSLDHSRPAVREEVKRIIDFWASFGVDGLRMDAAAHMIEGKAGSRPERPHDILVEYREFIESRIPEPLVIGEVDETPDEMLPFFGGGDELNALFNFYLNNHVFLALARRRAEPVARALRRLPAPPPGCVYAPFLRNLDELDLERLTDEERQEVYEAFAPEEDMRIFGRGIRRRLAPMLEDDPARLRMAMSLLFSLPGAPVLVYGDEIGIGEDLRREGRDAVRVPMQWSAGENAGFSEAAADRLLHPVVTEGRFGFPHRNVEAQQSDPDSLLAFVRAAIRARREHPEIGCGRCTPLETGDDRVLALRHEWKGRVLVALNNFDAAPMEVRLKASAAALRAPRQAFPAPAEADPGAEVDLDRIPLGPFGFLWIESAEAAG